MLFVYQIKQLLNIKNKFFKCFQSDLLFIYKEKKQIVPNILKFWKCVFLFDE